MATITNESLGLQSEEDVNRLFLPASLFDSTHAEFRIFCFSVSEQLEKFLKRNPETYVSLKLFDELSYTFQTLNIEAKGEISLIYDDESPDWEGLKIEFKIKNKTYPEILNLWDEIAKEAFEKLDPNAAKKIEVVLSRG